MKKFSNYLEVIQETQPYITSDKIYITKPSKVKLKCKSSSAEIPEKGYIATEVEWLTYSDFIKNYGINHHIKDFQTTHGDAVDKWKTREAIVNTEDGKYIWITNSPNRKSFKFYSPPEENSHSKN